MLTISNTIRRTQTPDGGILLDIERGQMFCLNAIGSNILELLDAGYDEGQIADQVSAAYGADIGVVRADVHEFLEALNQHHILKQGGPAATSEPEATHGSTDAT
jgi:hypothetical protein